MKSLGVQTADFSVYYDIVQAFRTKGVAFVPLAPGEPIPLHVGVVVTSVAEAPLVDHPAVVPFTTPEDTLAEALRLLHGPGPFRLCLIGIDPGDRPGIAVLADGKTLRLIHAASPEAVRGALQTVLSTLPAERFLVRIGHGAPTCRDRILRTLVDLDVPLELVDETRSTPVSYHGNAERDTAAALAIALLPGTPITAQDIRPVTPTEGELRDIQRKSRMASQGAVTITKDLAMHVALGVLTLDEAVSQMLQKA